MCHRQGIKRKGATLFIAAVQFVHGFGTFLFASLSMDHSISRTAFFVLVAASAMNMWLALVLLIGVHMGRLPLLIIWLVWAAVTLILFVISVPFIALYSYAITEHFKGANFAAMFLMYSLSFFLHCLFIHIVYGYYEELVYDLRMEKDLQRLEEEHGNCTPISTITSSTNEVSTCEVKNEIAN